MSREQNAACLASDLAAERDLDMDATLATLHPACVFVDEPLGLARPAGRCQPRRPPPQRRRRPARRRHLPQRLAVAAKLAAALRPGRGSMLPSPLPDRTHPIATQTPLLVAASGRL
jgi:hypothetical protein